MLKTLHKLGLDSTKPVRVRGRGGRAARRRRRRAPRSGHARRPDARQDLRRHVRHRHRQGRPPARDLPLPRARQRARDARVGAPGGRAPDRAQPGRRARAARRGRVVGRGRARPGGLPAAPFLELLADYGAPHGIDERRRDQATAGRALRDLLRASQKRSVRSSEDSSSASSAAERAGPRSSPFRVFSNRADPLRGSPAARQREWPPRPAPKRLLHRVRIQCASQPASIGKTLPVIAQAPGPQRNSTAAATSSGSISRLTAFSESRTSATTRSSSMPCARA